MITAEQLRERLSYDPETGEFVRLKSKQARYVGKRAGKLKTHGYRAIHIDGKDYYEHRLAWLYVTGAWPAAEIDHINGDPLDNRLANLRSATHAENLRNQKMSKNNRSGLKGVSWNAQRNVWCAFIRTGASHQHLGSYATAKAAHDAYVKAAREQHGEFARVA